VYNGAAFSTRLICRRRGGSSGSGGKAARFPPYGTRGVGA